MLPNFIALGQTMYEKSVTIFTTCSILAPQGDPLCRVSLVLALMYSNAHSINVPNFVPFWKFLCEIPAAQFC